MSVMKVWDGSSWTYPFYINPKVWDGTQWAYGDHKVWINSILPDTKTLTVGYANNDVIIPFPGSGWADRTYGFSFNIGSMSSTKSLIYPAWDGTEISELYYRYTTISGVSETVTLNIPFAPDSTWTTLTINGYNYPRTSASYASGTWIWDASVVNPGINPFGTTEGVVITVSWS